MSELQKWTIDGEWLVGELFRMTAQGRVVCFHQDAEDELQRLREEIEQLRDTMALTSLEAGQRISLLSRAVEWMRDRLDLEADGGHSREVPPPELAPCILGERE